MKSNDYPLKQAAGLWTRFARAAILAFGIELWCGAAARGQGTVAPSSFHPFTTPDSTVTPFGRITGFESLTAPATNQATAQGAASAFGETPAPENSSSVPVPVTNDAGFAAMHFRVGPMIFNAGAGLGVQLSDNILSSSSNRESDVIVDPNLYVTGIGGFRPSTLSLSGSEWPTITTFSTRPWERG
jgi:hypothetical protein